MLGQFFRRLFGGGDGGTTIAATEDYKDYLIEATPLRDAAGWRVSGRISQGSGESRQVHDFTRADTSPNQDDIVAMTLRKGRQLIDERGAQLFDQRP
ncbi:hypothetical protein J2T57_002391 [Natronocella acetinitrilica]|uniref:Uncharacterized protein n=1 Tax=Natronocella acetinitrilica TaxID=414046 RepID=A0AAE3KCP6_9GAMM|nr:HlyU family transcriptional regulator [Natronocella acetinitrilica]MCP1675243.1 hypothetical protein [Natronocella acetinitrilica]